jgi:single-stranded-DNA-specific exonuclease
VWRDAVAVAVPGAAVLFDRVLAARGLAGPGAGAFLDPRLTQLHDPSLMPDMDRAAERLIGALRGGEAVVIYGDYDADGITATAILFHLMRGLFPGARVSTYVPHRDEGYGLSVAALEMLAAAGARVVVSVDCGVTAVEPARAARAAGVDLIITDHHNPPAEGQPLPGAYALVHPRLPGSAYPFGELSGAGVAYKLAWRMATLHAGGDRAHPAVRQLLVDLLAFAALGSVADVVPLLGENRVLVRFGMERIKHSPLLGLRALVEASGLAGANVGTMDAGFKLAPRLNAGGRMAHAQTAVELFTTDDPERARHLADELTRHNNHRRTVERAIAAQAAGLAESLGQTGPERRVIVLADPGEPGCEGAWAKGVVGIVCSRLVERYGRPTVLLCRDAETGQLHGSGRSIEGFNLHGALCACADLLTSFGGHDMAAGLKLSPTNLGAFTERLTGLANAAIAPGDLLPAVRVDAAATLGELTVEAVGRLCQLEPFGAGNPPVHVVCAGVVLDLAAQPMGSGGEHLALTLRDGGAGARQRALRCVAWKFGEHRGRLAAGVKLDVVLRPNISRYAGRQSVEPEVVDLRAAE